MSKKTDRPRYRRIRGKIIGLVLPLLAFSLFLGTAHATDPFLHIGFQDNDGFPLVMGKGKKIGTPPGIGVDIFLLAARDLNLDLNITRLPNKRVHHYLSTGFFDGSGFYSFKEERMKEGQFPMKDGKPDKSKRVDVISYYFYTLKSSPVSWDGRKLTGTKMVGANMGYSIVGNLEKMGLKVNEVKSTRQNLEMLVKGRILAYAAQDKTIDPVIAAHDKYKDIIKIGAPIKTKEYYFVFSHSYFKKNRELALQIWDRIEANRESVIFDYREKNIQPEID
jgi:polar amino acid transport system substrate-binding protein